MSSEICFRDYRATDLEAMFQLDEACFAEEFRFDRGSMREFAEEQNAIVRIAERVGGHIVGFVIVHVERVATGLRAYVVTLDVAAVEGQQITATVTEADAPSSGIVYTWKVDGNSVHTGTDAAGWLGGMAAVVSGPPGSTGRCGTVTLSRSRT